MMGCEDEEKLQVYGDGRSNWGFSCQCSCLVWCFASLPKQELGKRTDDWGDSRQRMRMWAPKGIPATKMIMMPRKDSKCTEVRKGLVMIRWNGYKQETLNLSFHFVSNHGKHSWTTWLGCIGDTQLRCCTATRSMPREPRADGAGSLSALSGSLCCSTREMSSCC